MTAEVEVLSPGLFSSLQDTGRTGFREFGVPMSGAMDSYASSIANHLLRNSPDAALLEITQQGPALRFSAASQIVITGACLSPQINDVAMDNNRICNIEPGDVVSFGRRRSGARAYLAIKGGFQSEVVLQSRSWYEGLTESYRLKKGMKLAYFPVENINPERLNSALKTDTYIHSFKVKVLEGPEYHYLSKAQKTWLYKNQFTMGAESNRMGFQLNEKLENSLEPILTGPVLPGTVQLTPSGKLIVLMRDAQTTGGYPRILQLTEHGINVLSQKMPGENFNFKLCEISAEGAIVPIGLA